MDILESNVSGFELLAEDGTGTTTTTTTNTTVLPEPTPSPPKPTGPRPLPDPPRDKDKLRIFALLVGINDYPEPIPKLGGCVKDVELVEKYLKNTYGNKAQIKKLLNTEATYDNIIAAFRDENREHLGLATGYDTIWFHFSGHGSQQFTAEEFLRTIEPAGKDQTVVCYQDDQNGSQLHLADKEIAVLLAEAEKRGFDQDTGMAPHIVVSLDCCHSGSGTRDDEVRPRNYDPTKGKTRSDALEAGGVRTINTYIGNYSASNIEVPMSTHVALSACESRQLAGDTDAGGVFTTSLIETLRATGEDVNYESLFLKTRSTARKKRKEQNPQFETIGGFNPYTRFLEGSSLGKPGRYPLLARVKDSGVAWFVKCGAINGLPSNAPGGSILMDIIDEKENKVVANAAVVMVSAQHSLITLLGEHTANPANVDDYQAEIRVLPAAPIYVLLSGTPVWLKAIKDRWEPLAAKSIHWLDGKPAGRPTLFTNQDGDEISEPPAIELHAGLHGELTLKNLQMGNQVLLKMPATGLPQDRHDLAVENLDKIANWMRTIALDNPNSKIRELFDFELVVSDKNARRIALTPKEDTEGSVQLFEPIVISKADAFKKTDDSGTVSAYLAAFNYRVKLKDTAGQSIFFYGYHLKDNCAIDFSTEQEQFLDPGQSKDMLSINNGQGFGWGPEVDEGQVSSWFKLIATTEELDYHRLEQTGLKGTRDSDSKELNPDRISMDWCAVTVRVDLSVEMEENPENPFEGLEF
ncbi:MAG: caspase family protein [Lewinellaceae bacterium]|nr:caspase family protein [Lewinellaceae bacterium]